MISHWLDGFNFTMEYFRLLLLKRSLQLMGICMMKLCSHWGKKSNKCLNVSIIWNLFDVLARNDSHSTLLFDVHVEDFLSDSWDCWDQWAMNSQSTVTSISNHTNCGESKCDSIILVLFVWLKTTVTSIWQTFISIIGVDLILVPTVLV